MDPLQQLIAQLSQQYAGGIGPIQRGTDPYDGSLNRYADMNIGGQQKRLMYQPGMQDGNTGAFGPGRYMTDLSGPMANPTTGKQGAVRGFFGEDGGFQGAEWWEDKTSWVDKVLSVAPALVLAAATAGAGGFLPGAAGGGAGAGAGAGAAAMDTAGLDALIGSLGQANGLNLTALNGMNYAAGAAGAMDTAGLDNLIGSLGEANGLNLTQLNGMNYATGAGAAAGGGGAAAPSSGKTLLDTAKTIGEYAVPAASLLSSASTLSRVQQPQMPDMIKPEAPPVPGANAPAEARGYQPGQNPILEVLGRGRGNRRSSGGTMLTGPGGVNMSQTRVGGNTLLGL